MFKLSYRNKIRLKQTIKTVLILLLVIFLIIGFYLVYLQRYVVYHRGSVSFDFSQTTQNIPLVESTEQDDTSGGMQNVQIIYVEDGNSSGSLCRISGYYITGDMLVNHTNEVSSVLNTLTEPCWILLDLKNTSGNFYYSTKITGAQTADINTVAVDEIITSLKNRGFKLIARIPAFADSAFALENMECALHMESGVLWADNNGGYWLDPANKLVQDYLQQICKELSSLGFSEVVFDEFYFPTNGNISYDSSQTKSEIISDAADAIKNDFTASNLIISFCTGDTTFPLDSVSGRLFFSNTTGANIDTIVTTSSGMVADPFTQLVFLTDSHDTRFDAYSTLQPLLDEGEDETEKITQPDTAQMDLNTQDNRPAQTE